MSLLHEPTAGELAVFAEHPDREKQFFVSEGVSDVIAQPGPFIHIPDVDDIAALTGMDADVIRDAVAPKDFSHEVLRRLVEVHMYSTHEFERSVTDLREEMAAATLGPRKILHALGNMLVRDIPHAFDAGLEFSIHDPRFRATADILEHNAAKARNTLMSTVTGAYDELVHVPDGRSFDVEGHTKTALMWARSTALQLFGETTRAEQDAMFDTIFDRYVSCEAI